MEKIFTFILTELSAFFGGAGFLLLHGLLIAVASHSEHRFYGTRASVVVVDGLSCGSWASEHRLRSCAQALVPGHVGSSQTKDRTRVFLLTLAGGVFTIEPLGKPRLNAFGVFPFVTFYLLSPEGLKIKLWEFPGGLVVRTNSCQGCGFNLWLEN